MKYLLLFTFLIFTGCSSTGDLVLVNIDKDYEVRDKTEIQLTLNGCSFTSLANIKNNRIYLKPLVKGCLTDNKLFPNSSYPDSIYGEDGKEGIPVRKINDFYELKKGRTLTIVLKQSYFLKQLLFFDRENLMRY